MYRDSRLPRRAREQQITSQHTFLRRRRRRTLKVSNCVARFSSAIAHSITRFNIAGGPLQHAACDGFLISRYNSIPQRTYR